jgi:isopentenyldiphosphate isomerase
LGITLPTEAFKKVGRITRHNSLCDVWLVCKDVAVPDMHLQREEVAQVRWVTPDQLMTMIKGRAFHHYGASYFRFVFENIGKLVGRNMSPKEDFHVD